MGELDFDKILDFGNLTLQQELEKLKQLGENVEEEDTEDVYNNFDTDEVYDEFFSGKRVLKQKNIVYSPENWAKVNPFNKKIVAEWIFDTRSRKIRESTLTQYYGDARLIVLYVLLYLDNIKLTEITKKQWKGYVMFLINTSVSNARVNRVLSVAKNIMNFVEESDDYPDYVHSTISKVQGVPKEARKEIIFISNDDFMALYNYLLKKKKYEQATLIALAYESAGRKSELAQVRKDSIRKDGNCTNTVIGKRGKRFQLIYFDLTKKAAKLYLETRKDNNPMLFVNKYGETLSANSLYMMIISLRKIFFQVTGKDSNFNVHSFRHSALENYNNGTHEVCKKKKIKNIAIDKLKHISHHDSVEVCNSYLRDKSLTELEMLFGIKMDNM